MIPRGFKLDWIPVLFLTLFASCPQGRSRQSVWPYGRDARTTQMSTTQMSTTQMSTTQSSATQTSITQTRSNWMNHTNGATRTKSHETDPVDLLGPVASPAPATPIL